MSNLLPNLEALLKHLAADTAGRQDARALAEAATTAETEDELDAALTEVIETWRRT